MPLTSYAERIPLTALLDLVNATGTTKTQLLNSGVQSGQRLDNLLCTNTDSIAHVVDFWAFASSTYYLLGSVSLPAGTGSAGTPAIDAMVTLVAAGQAGLLMAASYSLYASVEVTVVTGAVSILAMGGEF